jgi:hypothetical protein
MRLLNTTTLALEEYHQPPEKYAILSHTWDDEEVLSQDIIRKDRGYGKKGFQKVKSCCKIAASQGYTIVWIDNCSIDKSSSAGF